MIIGYIQYHPEDGTDLFNDLVECYRNVFADDPWNEWKKCPVCQHKWGKGHVHDLELINYRHCDVDLQDYWSKDHVAHDILTEVSRDASCWLAMDNDHVVGFCWGYGTTPHHLERKVCLPGLETIINDCYTHPNAVAYQDEVGVLLAYRKHGIGKEMVRRRMHDFRTMGLDIGILRTKTLPPTVTYLWYSNKGYEVIARYDDEDGRVIMGAPLAKVSL